MRSNRTQTQTPVKYALFSNIYNPVILLRKLSYVIILFRAMELLDIEYTICNLSIYFNSCFIFIQMCA